MTVARAARMRPMQPKTRCKTTSTVEGIEILDGRFGSKRYRYCSDATRRFRLRAHQPRGCLGSLFQSLRPSILRASRAAVLRHRRRDCSPVGSAQEAERISLRCSDGLGPCKSEPAFGGFKFTPADRSELVRPSLYFDSCIPQEPPSSLCVSWSLLRLAAWSFRTLRTPLPPSPCDLGATFDRSSRTAASCVTVLIVRSSKPNCDSISAITRWRCAKTALRSCLAMPSAACSGIASTRTMPRWLCRPRRAASGHSLRTSARWFGVGLIKALRTKITGRSRHPRRV